MSVLTPPPFTRPGAKPWPWLLGVDSHTLSHWAVQPEMPNWMARAYRWRHSRLPLELREGLPQPDGTAPDFGFPEHAFPVLAATSQKSGLCLAVVDPGAAGENSDRSAAAAAAAGFASRLRDGASPPRFSWLEPQDFRGGQRSRMFDGESVGLSCFLLSVLTLFGLRDWSDEVCATGCWRDDRLRPVDPDTLSNKLECAREWGFARVLLVEGQEGLEGTGWDGDACVFLSADPIEALLPALAALYSHGSGGNQIDAAFSRALAMLDIRLVRTHPDLADYAKSAVLAKRFQAMNALPWTCFRAHDLASRAALHAGDVDAAEDAHQRALRATPPRPWQIADPQLASYARYGIHAHGGVIAVDHGRWTDDDAEVRALRDAIRDIRKADRDEADYHLADMNLHSTLAMLLRFRGRLAGDAEELRRSWEELMLHEAIAPTLAEYSLRQNRHGNDSHRRRENYLIATLTDFDVLGCIPDACREHGARLWPADAAGEGEYAHFSGYDVEAWLKWKRLFEPGFDPSGVNRALDAMEARAGTAGDGKPVWRYPWTGVAETVVRFELGNVECRMRAGAMLARAEHILIPPKRGMLAILAMRSAELLELSAAEFAPKNEVHSQSKLRDLAKRLLAEAKKGRLIRDTCPY